MEHHSRAYFGSRISGLLDDLDSPGLSEEGHLQVVNRDVFGKVYSGGFLKGRAWDQGT